MTRIAIVDPQPAVRAGLVDAPAYGARASCPSARPAGREEAQSWSIAHRPDVVLLEPHLGDGDGLGLCRRTDAPRRRRAWSAYTDGEPTRHSRSRCASRAPTASSTSRAAPQELFEALRVVARGGTVAAAARGPTQLRGRRARVETDDLALLAMLVDGTSPADVAETLRLDGRRVARRIERLLGRLRPRRGTASTPA